MKRISVAAGLALAITAIAATSAQASTVTIGSPLTASFSPGGLPDPTTVQDGLPEAGANVTSPINGTIVAWHIIDASGGPFALRVVTHDSGLNYTGSGTSAPQTPTGLGLQTFTTNLPIHAGQLIGIDSPNSASKIGAASPGGSHYVGFNPILPNGVSTPAFDAGVAEYGFNAVIQPAPGVTSITPTSGSTTGGTTVTITGHDFQGSTDAVTFGGIPAKSVTVNSDTKITAVAPAVSSAGPVTVRVTTAAGTATAPQTFTYKSTAPSQTKITHAKINKHKHLAKFSFTATGATSFQCALVKRPTKKNKKAPKPHFRACASAKTYKHLKKGRYIFEVRGVNAVGTDPKPAISKFKI